MTATPTTDTATTDTPATGPQPPTWRYRKPATDAAALRDIRHELRHLPEKALQIKQAPAEFHPKLVVSDHVRGSSILDKIADVVNRICGSMWVFLAITDRHHRLALPRQHHRLRQDALAAAADHPQPAAAVDHGLAAGQRQPGAGRQ